MTFRPRVADVREVPDQRSVPGLGAVSECRTEAVVAVDYKRLLEKYLDLVGRREGVDFLPHWADTEEEWCDSLQSEGFTDDEAKELWRMFGGENQ